MSTVNYTVDPVTGAVTADAPRKDALGFRRNRCSWGVFGPAERITKAVERRRPVKVWNRASGAYIEVRLDSETRPIPSLPDMLWAKVYRDPQPALPNT